MNKLGFVCKTIIKRKMFCKKTQQYGLMITNLVIISILSIDYLVWGASVHQSKLDSQKIFDGQTISYHDLIANRNLIDSECAKYRLVAEMMGKSLKMPANCLYFYEVSNNIADEPNVNAEPHNILSGSDSILNNGLKEMNSMYEIDLTKPQKSISYGGMVPLNPIVLIPGITGSRLEARLNKKDGVNFLCRKSKDWYDIWFSLKMLLPLSFDCWLDNIVLNYNATNSKTYNQMGVEIRPIQFGSLASVEYLDPKQPELTSYFAPVIKTFEALGYVRDKSLLAAPYDFRKAPDEMQDYFEQLTDLIDTAISENGGQTVKLICHSMGCTNILIFLRQKSPEWRRLHIERLVALGAPWGGSVKAIKAMVGGDNLDIALLSETKMRTLLRTFPSIVYLLPNEQVFSTNIKIKNYINDLPVNTDEQHLLVGTPNYNYTVKDLPKLFDDLNMTDVKQMYMNLKDLIKPLEPLSDLKVDCIHSLNVPTVDSLIFEQEKDFPDGPYNVLKGDGDGTVNAASLLVCLYWKQLLPDMIDHRVIYNTNHMNMLRHESLDQHFRSQQAELNLVYR